MPQLIALIAERLLAVHTLVRFFSRMEPNMVVHVLQNLCPVQAILALQPLVEPAGIVILNSHCLEVLA